MNLQVMCQKNTHFSGVSVEDVFENFLSSFSFSIFFDCSFVTFVNDFSLLYCKICLYIMLSRKCFATNPNNDEVLQANVQLLLIKSSWLSESGEMKYEPFVRICATLLSLQTFIWVKICLAWFLFCLNSIRSHSLLTSEKNLNFRPPCPF